MKKVIWFLLIAVNCFGQEDNFHLSKNEFNVELLGSGIAYSLNYERTFAQEEKIEMKGSFGAHFNPIEIKWIGTGKTLGLNAEAKINWLLKRNSVETGVGYSYIHFLDSKSSEPLNLIISRLGYRFYNKRKVKYFGISFTPIFVVGVKSETADFNRYIPYGAIRYGWKF